MKTLIDSMIVHVNIRSQCRVSTFINELEWCARPCGTHWVEYVVLFAPKLCLMDGEVVVVDFDGHGNLVND